MSQQTDIARMIQGLQTAMSRVVDSAQRGLDQAGEVVLARAKKYVPVSPTNPYVMETYTTKSGKTRTRAAKDSQGRMKKNPYYTGTSGTLRDSGEAPPARIEHGMLMKDVRFTASYAAAVHEITDANHRYPGAVNPNAQAKYLERAVIETRDEIPQIVRDEINRAI